MFIIFGTNASVLASEPLPGIACGHCGNETLVASVVQRYFHAFWIPTFPLGKVRVTECTHCKEVLVDEQIDANANVAMEPVRDTKTPVWMYAGAMLFALMIGIGSLSGGGGSRTEYAVNRMYSPRATYSNVAPSRKILHPSKEMLQNPQIDDLYIVDLHSAFKLTDSVYRFGILKVKNFGDDTVAFHAGTIAYTDTDGAVLAIDHFEFKEMSYFIEESELVLRRKMLDSLFANGDLKHIVRPD